MHRYVVSNRLGKEARINQRTIQECHLYRQNLADSRAWGSIRVDLAEGAISWPLRDFHAGQRGWGGGKGYGRSGSKELKLEWKGELSKWLSTAMAPVI